MPMPENLTQSRKQNTGNQQELSTLLSATSNMADEQVAPELKPIKTKLEGIIGELKQLQGSGTPTQAQVVTDAAVISIPRTFCAHVVL